MSYAFLREGFNNEKKFPRSSENFKLIPDPLFLQTNKPTNFIFLNGCVLCISVRCSIENVEMNSV